MCACVYAYMYVYTHIHRMFFLSVNHWFSVKRSITIKSPGNTRVKR